MKTITIDFSGCNFADDMHTILKEAFLFPSFYGRNWDAFYDHGYDYIDHPLCVEIRGLKSLPKELSWDIGVMKEAFADLARELEGLEIKYCS